jgi:hypothetical protein
MATAMSMTYSKMVRRCDAVRSSWAVCWVSVVRCSRVFGGFAAGVYQSPLDGADFVENAEDRPELSGRSSATPSRLWRYGRALGPCAQCSRQRCFSRTRACLPTFWRR